jgi:hypothetical protein
MTPEQVKRLRQRIMGLTAIASDRHWGDPRWTSGDIEGVLALIEERLELRRLLFGTHSCPGKYGDDGELQCNTCRIDFLRDEWGAISAQLHAEGLRELEARVGNVGGWLTWLTERDKLIAERDRLLSEIQALTAPVEVGGGAAATYRAIRDERDRLREALLEYGKHYGEFHSGVPTCAYLSDFPARRAGAQPCSCGLSIALGEQEPGR